MTEVTISIIQRVKSALNIVDDIPSTELYDKLFEYRNNLHPDKFLDSKLKSEAEEKFKNLNLLIQELASFIDKEKLTKKPSELILYKKDYEEIILKQVNIEYENKIIDLQQSISHSETIIADLKKELSLLRNEKADKKTQELIKFYKPSKRNLLSLGITFISTLILGVLSKLDQIAQVISKYSPVNPQLLNSFFFFLLLIIPILYLVMIYEEKRIQFLSKKIKTPRFIRGFVNHLEEEGKSDTFNELFVFEYLSLKLKPKNPLLKVFFSNILHLYNDAAIDGLKDIFIFNLYNKQFIYISIPHRLDRTFKIRKSQYYPDIDDDTDF